MTVKELKTIIEALPDDTPVVKPYDGGYDILVEIQEITYLINHELLLID